MGLKVVRSLFHKLLLICNFLALLFRHIAAIIRIGMQGRIFKILLDLSFVTKLLING